MSDAVKLTDADLEAIAIISPAARAETVWQRLIEHGLSRGGRPRKIGHAARPISGPVTLAELGFKKGFMSRCRKLADIPEPDFEELLAAFRREGKPATTSGILRLVSAAEARASREP